MDIQRATLLSWRGFRVDAFRRAVEKLESNAVGLLCAAKIPVKQI
jgi:hypothetical protein